MAKTKDVETLTYTTISNYDCTNPDWIEQNDGTIMTDDSGYIDKNTYIAQMLEAGETLDEIRSGTYEYDDDEEEPEIDITRSGWIDPSDIDQIAMGLNSKFGEKHDKANEKTIDLKRASPNAENDEQTESNTSQETNYNESPNTKK